MRTLETMVVITCLAAYVSMVVTTVVVVFAKGGGFSPVDMPIILAGTIAGVLGIKGAQSVFGEKDTTTKPPQQ